MQAQSMLYHCIVNLKSLIDHVEEDTQPHFFIFSIFFNVALACILFIIEYWQFQDIYTLCFAGLNGIPT